MATQLVPTRRAVSDARVFRVSAETVSVVQLYDRTTEKDITESTPSLNWRNKRLSRNKTFVHAVHCSLSKIGQLNKSLLNSFNRKH